jgi:hypothetical protein
MAPDASKEGVMYEWTSQVPETQPSCNSANSTAQLLSAPPLPKTVRPDPRPASPQAAKDDASIPGPLTASATLAAELGRTPAPSILGQRPSATAPARRKKSLPPDFTPRRSERIRRLDDGTNKGPIARAQTVLVKRLGLVRGEETITKEAMDEYLALFKKPLARQHVRAIAALFDPDGAAFDEPAYEGFDAFTLPAEVEPSGA